jgi:hypothetical protein
MSTILGALEEIFFMFLPGLSLVAAAYLGVALVRFAYGKIRKTGTKAFAFAPFYIISIIVIAYFAMGIAGDMSSHTDAFDGLAAGLLTFWTIPVIIADAIVAAGQIIMAVRRKRKQKAASRVLPKSSTTPS